jgi:hypothetical protein
MATRGPWRAALGALLRSACVIDKAAGAALWDTRVAYASVQTL